MPDNSIHSTRRSNNVSGQTNGTAQDKQPTVNINQLMQQYLYLQEQVQELRQDDINQTNNDDSDDEDSNSSSRVGSTYQSQSNQDRIYNYLSRMYEIMLNLGQNADVQDLSQSSNNGSGQFNGGTDQSVGSYNARQSTSPNGGFFSNFTQNVKDGFNSFAQNTSDFFNSATNTISDGFNNFVDNVSSGFKNIINEIGDFFVSQRPGATNTNEDGGYDNSNCALANLVMINRMFGAGGDASTADQDIENARQAAGVTMDESQGITVDAIAQGANNMGMQGTKMTGGIDEIENQLNQGSKVIVALNAAKLRPEENLASTGHAITIVGIDREAGTALVFDPAKQEPTVVSLANLQSAMSDFNNEFVSVSKAT